MVKVIKGIVHFKKADYKEGAIIQKLPADEEERLIKLKVAEQVTTIPANPASK